MYTREFGLQSYLVRGVHSKKSKIKANYFHGLMLLDMIATHSDTQSLGRINEITAAKSFTPEFDPVKSAIAIFLNELIYKTIQETEANPGLFEFLITALDLLSLKENKASNFHLSFMIRYTQYLGFYPTFNYSPENRHFDLKEACFVRTGQGQTYVLEEELSRHFYELMNSKLEVCEQVQVTNTQRKALLSALLDYYKWHRALTSDLISHTIMGQL